MDYDKTMAHGFEDMEGELSLPRGFILGIYKEDDWSFIIKIHALLEGSISHLLVKYFGNDDLTKVVERLELNNIDSGKMAFINSLRLLTKKEQGFILLISTIRNSIVHNIRNVNFSLEIYISGLDKNQRKSFNDKIIHFTSEESSKQKWLEVIISNPKASILVSVFFLISKISALIIEAKFKKSVVDEHLKYLMELK